MKVGKKFAPHPNLKKVYFVYLGLVAIIPLIVTSLPIWATYIFAPEIWRATWAHLFIPLTIVLAILCFLACWIPKYYRSISYVLKEDEVMVERGVWWKMKHVVPYARVMSVDVIQGPISRHFGVGSVHVYTAGYTGMRGGTAGPGSRGAEACIWGVPNFMEIRDVIIGLVRGRPLFGAPDVGLEMLKELRKIRKAVKK
ncbi:MAG: PH domain-containing protein [Candidatus Hodarchaeaceae archaeon]|nr:PH domain-containing protein [Candidatus Hodarchaeaceae archaeon]